MDWHQRTSPASSVYIQHYISHPLINYSSPFHVPRGSPEMAERFVFVALPRLAESSSSRFPPSVISTIASLLPCFIVHS